MYKLERLKDLRAKATDPEFQKEWMTIKRQRKVREIKMCVFTDAAILFHLFI